MLRSATIFYELLRRDVDASAPCAMMSVQRGCVEALIRVRYARYLETGARQHIAPFCRGRAMRGRLIVRERSASVIRAAS